MIVAALAGTAQADPDLHVHEAPIGTIRNEDQLKAKGVAVVMEAVHLCMLMRGVEKQNSKAITSAMLGSFRDDARTRDEFLRLAYR